MKIIITSQSRDLEATVDPRFGRSRHFILFDTQTGDWDAIDNKQNLNAIQGAGIQSAENVSKTGAEFVLTGHCGPKAFKVLSSNGIKVITGIEGSVKAAIERFKNGELKPVEDADVEGHWV